MEKIKEYFYITKDWVDNYSNVVFRYISKHPKTITAIWAVSLYVTWRLS